ncbi:MAG: RbsD/FucU domain-containing protein [Nakamurella sp.]
MLNGIPSALTGEVLAHLDAMGHGDTVVVADAHFPASSLAERLVELPGVSVPEAVRAIRAVFPLDPPPFAESGVDLMRSGDGERLAVQQEIIDAAQLSDSDAPPRDVERFAFYEEAAVAYLIIRTGELRPYANAILSKGLATPDESWRG